MATLPQKIVAEQNARAMLDDNGMPQPDEVEYGHTCIRLLWHQEKVALIVDIDEPPSAVQLDDDIEEVIGREETRPRTDWRAPPPF